MHRTAGLTPAFGVAKADVTEAEWLVQFGHFLDYLESRGWEIEPTG